MKNKLRQLPTIKRLVVKVGSSLLTEGKKRGIQQPFLRSLAGQLRRLQLVGVDSIVVSSGAIAAGMHELGLKQRPKEIPRLQALAAVGQCNLMQAYESTFKNKNLKVSNSFCSTIVLLLFAQDSYRLRPNLTINYGPTWTSPVMTTI